MKKCLMSRKLKNCYKCAFKKNRMKSKDNMIYKIKGT